MIYDLAVVGNGIAAQTFLWNLSENSALVKKSQNFSVAHIHNEKIAPSCSLRSVATVSQNGVEENAPGLGQDLLAGYQRFSDFIYKYNPEGAEPVRQGVIYTNEKDHQKMIRRFKTLNMITHPWLKDSREGVELITYMIGPERYLRWFQSFNAKNLGQSLFEFPFFLKDMHRSEAGYVELSLENHQKLKARKVVLCLGAYSKIFGHFFSEFQVQEADEKCVIKAGTYLERTIDLGEKSQLLIIDMQKVLYRSHDKILQIGSVTSNGPMLAPDLSELRLLYEKCRSVLNFDPGKFEDFKVVTGLRHKGPRRKFIAGSVGDSPHVFMINGFYKNGFTLSFLAAQKMSELLGPITAEKS